MQLTLPASSQLHHSATPWGSLSTPRGSLTKRPLQDLVAPAINGGRPWHPELGLGQPGCPPTEHHYNVKDQGGCTPSLDVDFWDSAAGPIPYGGGKTYIASMANASFLMSHLSPCGFIRGMQTADTAATVPPRMSIGRPQLGGSTPMQTAMWVLDN